MKRFVFLLLLLGLGAAGYHYWPEIQNRIQEARNTDKTSAPESALPSPGEARSSLPPPRVSTPEEPAKAPAARKYPTVEDFTANWTKISPTAFPRPVSLKKETAFTNKIGSSKFKAGSEVQALGLDKGQLVLAPTAESPFRASVALDDTSLKTDLTKLYDEWIAKIRKRDAAADAYRQSLASAPAPETPPATASSADLGPAPQPGPDGKYPVAIQSLGSMAKEIEPGKISRWEKPRVVNVDGKTYWGLVIGYKVQTPFGSFDTEGQALIRNNRVEKWVYTGSNEEIL